MKDRMREYKFVAGRDPSSLFTFYGTVGTPAPDAESDHNLLELLARCFPNEYVYIEVRVPDKVEA